LTFFISGFISLLLDILKLSTLASSFSEDTFLVPVFKFFLIILALETLDFFVIIFFFFVFILVFLITLALVFLSTLTEVLGLVFFFFFFS